MKWEIGGGIKKGVLEAEPLRVGGFGK